MAEDDSTGSGTDAARAALARARAASREGTGASPARRSGGSSRRRGDGRDPVLTGEVLRELAGERGWSGPTAVAGVLGDWPAIVGAQVAAHVVPEGFDQEQGKLVLRADSTTWATAIRMQRDLVERRIAELVGAGVVRTITVLGPAAPSWRHGPRVAPGRGPRDTYG